MCILLLSSTCMRSVTHRGNKQDLKSDLYGMGFDYNGISAPHIPYTLSISCNEYIIVQFLLLFCFWLSSFLLRSLLLFYYYYLPSLLTHQFLSFNSLAFVYSLLCFYHYSFLSIVSVQRSRERNEWKLYEYAWFTFIFHFFHLFCFVFNAMLYRMNRKRSGTEAPHLASTHSKAAIVSQCLSGMIIRRIYLHCALVLFFS